jgi:hypothetical protein
MQSWIEDELATAEFGDRRLKKRAGLLLDRMGGHPQLSIPAACRGWAETAAAYRFFANEKVTAERVLKPHQDATVRRMAEHEVVLVPQDTSELDYTGHDETKGLGPLNWEERIGLFKHTALVVTPGRLCLGVVDVKIWGRREGRETDRAKVKKMPIEEKESFRWIEGYRRACDLAQQVPNTKIVSLSDREGDIYELFVEHQEMKGPTKRAEWIVRSCQDRRLTADDPTNEGAEKIRAHLATAPVLGEVEVIVARSRGREEQTVTVEIRAARVRLKPPHRTGKKLPELAVNAVWVREIHPPAGSEPLDWLLLTSLPVGTFDEAFRVVDYYCCRWQIELFFKVLKSGCEVEKLQLETDARLKAAIALYAIIAWRVMYVMRLGRECPHLPCTAVFEDAEWQSVWTISKKGPLPDEPPPLGVIVQLIASLGGYLARKSDGPPGLKTVWIGLQRTRDFAHAWSTFGPGRPERCV